MQLSDFRVLTFDCYGTLVDWETGLLAALRPWLKRVGIAASDDDVLAAFAAREHAVQAGNPRALYPQVLAEVHAELARHWDVAVDQRAAELFGQSITAWPPFPDTIDALKYLKGNFKLVILSNVDRMSFAFTNRRLEVAFDAVYTAQDIGSYKPSPRNFAYLIERLAEQGHPKSDILHVAQSLFHDHVPAQAAGLRSAWIDRQAGRGGATPPTAAARYNFRFSTLAGLADAHRAEGRR